MVLKIFLTAGGASAASLEAEPKAAKRGLSSVWPVWNTGRFAATKVTALAGAKAYATHRAINTVLQNLFHVLLAFVLPTG